jgi:hypothetical protein
MKDGFGYDWEFINVALLPRRSSMQQGYEEHNDENMMEVMEQLIILTTNLNSVKLERNRRLAEKEKKKRRFKKKAIPSIWRKIQSRQKGSPKSQWTFE